ncbi:MAG: hypothetical protein D6820_11730 [Lentisphaerae bacterium]|nr:MAG: hypothetical protein D6820_11730 [Lentisphaerota bacterium]
MLLAGASLFHILTAVLPGFNNDCSFCTQFRRHRGNDHGANGRKSGEDIDGMLQLEKKEGIQL